MMTPLDYHSSRNSPFLIDLNEDQTHHDMIFSLKSQASSSSSSLSCPSFSNPSQDHGGCCVQQSQQLQDQEAKISVEVGRSCENERTLKFSIWKEEDKKKENNDQTDHGSVKWMSSKMRLMRKMMKSSDHGQKYEDQKPSSPLETDNSSSSSHNNNNNNTIRVCADCNTTKTPLWRSGPRGPKSLCNACGIRQRKARRAMAAAAAAAANGTVVAAETASSKSKLQHKDKTSSNGFKKKCKHMTSPGNQGRKKLCFEELRIILSQKYSAFHGVFPQDEKEAAILLMALSYGLVHG